MTYNGDGSYYNKHFIDETLPITRFRVAFSKADKSISLRAYQKDKLQYDRLKVVFFITKKKYITFDCESKFSRHFTLMRFDMKQNY